MSKNFHLGGATSFAEHSKMALATVRRNGYVLSEAARKGHEELIEARCAATTQAVMQQRQLQPESRIPFVIAGFCWDGTQLEVYLPKDPNMSPR